MRLLQARSQRAKVECFLDTVETFLTRRPFITTAKWGTKALCWDFNWLLLFLPRSDYLVLFTGNAGWFKKQQQAREEEMTPLGGNRRIEGELSALKTSFGVTGEIRGVLQSAQGYGWFTTTCWDTSGQELGVVGTLDQYLSLQLHHQSQHLKYFQIWVSLCSRGLHALLFVARSPEPHRQWADTQKQVPWFADSCFPAFCGSTASLCYCSTTKWPLKRIML